MVEFVVLLYTSVFQRYQLSTCHSQRTLHIKGLKEVPRQIEEGGEVDSNTIGIVVEFLKNFPPPTTLARKLSDFPAELLQLFFSYLPLW